MSKSNLYPFPLLSGQSMGASFTSSAIDIMNQDNVCITLVNSATGTPVGTYVIQGSNDAYTRDGLLNASAEWADLPSASLAVNGAFSVMLDFNQLGFRWIRVKYTRSSGTGTANSIITAKQV